MVSKQAFVRNTVKNGVKTSRETNAVLSMRAARITGYGEPRVPSPGELAIFTARSRAQAFLKMRILKILLALEGTSCWKIESLNYTARGNLAGVLCPASKLPAGVIPSQSRETFWVRETAGCSSHLSEFRGNIWHPLNRP